MKYSYNKICNLSKLREEIKKSSLGPFFLSLTLVGSSLTVEMNKSLSTSERDHLDSLIENHSLEDLKSVIKSKILGNIDFGLDLIAEYGAKRAIRGTTALQTAIVDQKLAGIQAMLLSGSLPTALTMIQSLQADEDIPQEDIDEFVSKIQEYLQS